MFQTFGRMHAQYEKLRETSKARLNVVGTLQLFGSTKHHCFAHHLGLRVMANEPVSSVMSQSGASPASCSVQ
jgi:hypothetical protein